MTVKLASSRGRTASKLQRAEPAPCTHTRAGPSPLPSQAILPPSGPSRWRSTRATLVVGAQPVPAVELDRFRGELHQALGREPGQHRAERLLLADAGVEGVLALEAGGDAERLAA